MEVSNLMQPFTDLNLKLIFFKFSHGLLHTCLFNVLSVSLQMAILFFVIWGASAVVFLFSDQFGIANYTHPLALSCFFLIFAINTLNVCFRHARFWLLKALVISSTRFDVVFHVGLAFDCTHLLLWKLYLWNSIPWILCYIKIFT